MERVFEIQRTGDGKYRAAIRGTDTGELADALAGLMCEEEGQPLFDVFVDALSVILSDWSDEDVDSFTDGLNAAAKRLRVLLQREMCKLN